MQIEAGFDVLGASLETPSDMLVEPSRQRHKWGLLLVWRYSPLANSLV
jgi:homoserine kinase